MKLPTSRDLSKVPTYTPGKSEARVKAEYGLETVIKLASNENPLGCSPLAIRAAQEQLLSSFRYPDHSSDTLRQRLGEHHGLPMDHFIVTAGLEEMINCIGRAYLLPGDESLIPEISFIKYIISVRLTNSEPVCIPMKDMGIDLDATKARITDRTKIIWIANPNNPTGSYIPAQALMDFLADIPPHVLVVIDEAYIDFADAPDFPTGTDRLFETYPQVIILRTFSKAYGLADFRIGYAIGLPELLQNVLKVREIFSVSSLSEAAACGALDDTEFLFRYKKLVHEEKLRIYQACDQLAFLGVDYLKTQANFIYITTPMDSRELFASLQAKGVIVRPAGAQGIRVTIGLPEENDAFLQALEQVLTTNRSQE